jgi:hypothetical protein
MENAVPNPIPLQGIVMAWPANDGKAFAIRLQLPDGELDLELDDTMLRQLLQALMESSEACVPKRSDLRPIAEVDLADGVQLPASSLDVLPLGEDGEARRLVMRVGSIDLNLMIDSRATAQALATALIV